MKYRAFVATIFLLEISTPALLAQGSPPMSARNSARSSAYQEKGSRDVSQNAWSSWEAPVSTVDPGQLISSDSADLTASNGLAEPPLTSLKGDSFHFASSLNDGAPVHAEKTKSIQEVETSASSPAVAPSPSVQAVVAPNRGSKRILLIALACVAVLAYRKFRRANAGPYPRKPSFL